MCFFHQLFRFRTKALDQNLRYCLLNYKHKWSHVFRFSAKPLQGNFSSADVDECTIDDHKCHLEAACINTAGSYNCSCKPGFEGDGYNCKRKCSLTYQLSECPTYVHLSVIKLMNWKVFSYFLTFFSCCVWFKTFQISYRASAPGLFFFIWMIRNRLIDRTGRLIEWLIGGIIES